MTNHIGSLFDGLVENDNFNGKEYKIVVCPLEGEIVRINLHRDVNVISNGRRLRDHFVLVVPHKSNIHRNGYASFTVNCFCVDLGGHFGYTGICYCPKTDIIVRPTMEDLFEFADKARINGLIYDRERKIIMNKKKYKLERKFNKL